MNAQPIIADWQFASILLLPILALAGSTIAGIISDAREARRRRALRGGK